MVLELNKLYEVKNEQQNLINQMKYDVNFWLSANGLTDVFHISRLNGFYVCLESYDVALTDELLNDFEVVFGVVCESIRECSVRKLIDGTSFVKYSYYFCQSGGIY